MERKGELLYQRFLNTAQETVRLTAALALALAAVWLALRKFECAS